MQTARPATAPRPAWRLAFALALLAVASPLAPAALAQQGPASAASSDEGPLLATLNVRDADLRDVFRGIAHEHDLNLLVDNRIDRRVTARLSGVPVLEAVRYLCRQNGLELVQRGRIFRVELPPAPAPAPPKPPAVTVRDSLLTVDLDGDDLGAVLRAVGQQSGRSVIVRPGLQGTLSGLLQGVPLGPGLRSLLQSNGFALHERDGIFHVDRLELEADGGRGRLWVQVDSGRVSFDVTAAPIERVLRELAARLDVNLVTYAAPEGSITARARALTLDEALGLLLKGTGVAYRREGAVYVVGPRETSGIATTRLVPLDHIRAEVVMELLPAPVLEAAAVLVVKEHNGLMVTGPSDVIAEVERLVSEVDYPTPQILIEALVVDFEATDLFELGVTFGRDAVAAADASQGGFRFGEADPYSDGVEASADGRQANELLDGLASLPGLSGIQNIGRLPDDFYAKIHALSVEGKVDVRSRPQVSTLNGHAASITIGTTQYYILKTATPYTSPGQVYVQEMERFEKIEANVRLEVVPWVSASGEVTTEIRPEFSTPVGEFVPGVPPTINSRILESTVRLSDGETIVLGGLIQEADAATVNKVPVLGSIPLLGRLFRSRSVDRRKSELVIFLTPHVFYGDERDSEKWRELQRKLRYTPEGERIPKGAVEHVRDAAHDVRQRLR